ADHPWRLGRPRRSVRLRDRDRTAPGLGSSGGLRWRWAAHSRLDRGRGLGRRHRRARLLRRRPPRRGRYVLRQRRGHRSGHARGLRCRLGCDHRRQPAGPRPRRPGAHPPLAGSRVRLLRRDLLGGGAADPDRFGGVLGDQARLARFRRMAVGDLPGRGHPSLGDLPHGSEHEPAGLRRRWRRRTTGRDTGRHGPRTRRGRRRRRRCGGAGGVPHPAPPRSPRDVPHEGQRLRSLASRNVPLPVPFERAMRRMHVLETTERGREYQDRLNAFMDEFVYPAEPVYAEQMAATASPHTQPPVLEDLKAEAKRQGLWNLFHPHAEWGPGLTNFEYAPLAEITGRSIEIAPEAINCNAPDTGNMEVFTLFGTDEHKEKYLRPLLEGTMASAFAMTEPDVASSDATNVEMRMERTAEGFLLNGRKWFASNGMHPNCR